MTKLLDASSFYKTALEKQFIIPIFSSPKTLVVDFDVPCFREVFGYEYLKYETAGYETIHKSSKK